MLDKKTAAVLNTLANEVGYSYKVVKKQQLVSALPQKYHFTEDELVAIIAFLKENEYLTVKYQDQYEICLALSVKAESYLAGEGEPAIKTQMPKGQAWILAAICFASAFLGAFVAVLLGTLL